MADEAKVEAQVTEAPAKESTAQDAAREEVIASLEEPIEEVVEESQTKESETSTEAESSPAEKTDEKPEEDSELKELLKNSKEDKSKDNVQRRIDQLTARLKTLEEENIRLKSKDTTKEQEYTDDQLKFALKKAMDEGDSNLVFQIMDYKTKKLEKDLVAKYEQAEAAKQNAVNAMNAEWKKVQDSYSKVWQDEVTGKEIYPGAEQELNLGKPDSLLYKLALSYFGMKDEDGNYIYNFQGGQRTAVSDALSAILRKKRITPQSDGKVKKLERTLAKEKRKKALSGSGTIEEESTSSRPLSDGDQLSDYINERKKYQIERGK